jgi:hypothetical protein
MKISEIHASTFVEGFAGAFELLDLTDIADEDVLQHTIDSRKLKLHFNGAGLVMVGRARALTVEAMARKQAGKPFTDHEVNIVPENVSAILYDVREQAIYLKRDYTVKLRGALDQRGVEVETKVTAKKGLKGSYNVEQVPEGTCAKLARDADVMNIQRVMSMDNTMS